MPAVMGREVVSNADETSAARSDPEGQSSTVQLPSKLSVTTKRPRSPHNDEAAKPRKRLTTDRPPTSRASASSSATRQNDPGIRTGTPNPLPINSSDVSGNAIAGPSVPKGNNGSRIQARNSSKEEYIVISSDEDIHISSRTKSNLTDNGSQAASKVMSADQMIEAAIRQASPSGSGHAIHFSAASKGKGKEKERRKDNDLSTRRRRQTMPIVVEDHDSNDSDVEMLEPPPVPKAQSRKSFPEFRVKVKSKRPRPPGLGDTAKTFISIDFDEEPVSSPVAAPKPASTPAAPNPPPIKRIPPLNELPKRCIPTTLLRPAIDKGRPSISNNATASTSEIECDASLETNKPELAANSKPVSATTHPTGADPKFLIPLGALSAPSLATATAQSRASASATSPQPPASVENHPNLSETNHLGVTIQPSTTSTASSSKTSNSTFTHSVRISTLPLKQFPSGIGLTRFEPISIDDSDSDDEPMIISSLTPSLAPLVSTLIPTPTSIPRDEAPPPALPPVSLSKPVSILGRETPLDSSLLDEDLPGLSAHHVTPPPPMKDEVDEDESRTQRDENNIQLGLDLEPIVRPEAVPGAHIRSSPSPVSSGETVVKDAPSDPAILRETGAPPHHILAEAKSSQPLPPEYNPVVENDRSSSPTRPALSVLPQPAVSQQIPINDAGSSNHTTIADTPTTTPSDSGPFVAPPTPTLHLRLSIPPVISQQTNPIQQLPHADSSPTPVLRLRPSSPSTTSPKAFTSQLESSFVTLPSPILHLKSNQKAPSNDVWSPEQPDPGVKADYRSSEAEQPLKPSITSLEASPARNDAKVTAESHGGSGDERPSLLAGSAPDVTAKIIARSSLDEDKGKMIDASSGAQAQIATGPENFPSVTAGTADAGFPEAFSHQNREIIDSIDGSSEIPKVQDDLNEAPSEKPVLTLSTLGGDSGLGLANLTIGEDNLSDMDISPTQSDSAEMHASGLDDGHATSDSIDGYIDKILADSQSEMSLNSDTEMVSASSPPKSKRPLPTPVQKELRPALTSESRRSSPGPSSTRLSLNQVNKLSVVKNGTVPPSSAALSKVSSPTKSLKSVDRSRLASKGAPLFNEPSRPIIVATARVESSPDPLNLTTDAPRARVFSKPGRKTTGGGDRSKSKNRPSLRAVSIPTVPVPQPPPTNKPPPPTAKPSLQPRRNMARRTLPPHFFPPPQSTKSIVSSSSTSQSAAGPSRLPRQTPAEIAQQKEQRELAKKQEEIREIEEFIKACTLQLPSYIQDHIRCLPSPMQRDPGFREVFEAVMRQNTAEDEPLAPPITCVNNVDDEPCPPWEFYYTNKTIYGHGVPPPRYDALIGCDCVGSCDPQSETCSCVKRQRENSEVSLNYQPDGTIVWHQAPIFECNDACECSEECVNRTIRRGRKVKLSIEKTKMKGWGVFAKQHIPAGTYIGLYSSELLNDTEAEQRGKVYNDYGRTYLFDLDFAHLNNGSTGVASMVPTLATSDTHISEEGPAGKAKGSNAKKPVYTMDAFHVGNHTRFFNHSCEPNMLSSPVYINDPDIEKPMLAFFTSEEVEYGEELCFSYKGGSDDEGDEDDDDNDDDDSEDEDEDDQTDVVFGKCYCGAKRCNGSMFKQQRKKKKKVKPDPKGKGKPGKRKRGAR